MRKLTDFQLAAVASIPSLIGGFIASTVDIWWAAVEFNISGLDHLPVVIVGLVLSLVAFLVTLPILFVALKRHKETGKKPVQGTDDIDYRIDLYMRKEAMRKLETKARVAKHIAYRTRKANKDRKSDRL